MAASTTDELNRKFRQEVDDLLEGYDANHPDSENLWKECEIYGYMTEAADKVAKDIEGVYRVFTYPVVTGVQAIKISNSILHVRNARLVTYDTTLWPTALDVQTYRVQDDYGVKVARGAFTTIGPPQNYMLDYKAGRLYLLPIPNNDDTLELQATVRPGVPYDAGTPITFTDEEAQRMMLHYMKYLAYQKQDADVVDLQRSTSFKKLYDERIPFIKVEQRSYRRAPQPIRMEW